MIDLQEDLLSRYNLVVHSYKDNRVDDIPLFLEQVNNIVLKGENSVIQLLDCDNICGLNHLNQAVASAIKAFDEKQNFSKQLGLEVCVRLSAQKQINIALKNFGIKNSGDITVLYINCNDAQILEMEKLLSDRDDSLIDVYDEDRICELYNLSPCEDMLDRINEEIALLALKN